jgi:integrase
VSILQALDLLGGILQRAVEGGRPGRNPVRLVRRIARPRRKEVKPLAPATVEAMRATSGPRDATLLSVLAYAGLRSQEALALQWCVVRLRTLLVQRAVSLGQEKDTKTRAHRTVRLLAPLHEDLLACSCAQGDRARTRWSSPDRRAGCGRRRLTTTGANAPSIGRAGRRRSRTRLRTRCDTPSSAVP